MIISRAPYRISLFGGSTDYPSYYSKYEALLLGFTINHYCTTIIRHVPPILNNKYILKYSKTEKTDESKLIEHDGCRGLVQFYNVPSIEIDILDDLPARTGIGSSSSFIVAGATGICTLFGYKSTKKQLALDAINIERKLLKEPGGIQDQIWASYGGMNSIRIRQNGDFIVKPLPISDEFKEELNKHLLLFYTGEQRQSFDLAQSHDTMNGYKTDVHNIAYEALGAFTSEDIQQIGNLLNESWLAKKKIAKNITSDNIDKIYSYAITHGAIGGKLLGSGTSGFMVFIVIDKTKEFIECMEQCNLIHVNYGLDNQGATII